MERGDLLRHLCHLHGTDDLRRQLLKASETEVDLVLTLKDVVHTLTEIAVAPQDHIALRPQQQLIMVGAELDEACFEPTQCAGDEALQISEVLGQPTGFPKLPIELAIQLEVDL